MNHWTKLSIEYADQRSYLDDLFQVYPTIPEGIRDLDGGLWEQVEKALGIQPVRLDEFLRLKGNAVLDGVLYIKGKNKMYKDITGKLKNENIMSALVLREFLYQV